MYNGLYPVLIGFNSIPKVAIVPVLVVWFGIGAVPAIITAFLISFFPIAVNVATGLATLEPELEDVLRSLGAQEGATSSSPPPPPPPPPRSACRARAPYFFASLKVAITLAFVGSVILGDRRLERGHRLSHAAGEFAVPDPAGVSRD